MADTKKVPSLSFPTSSEGHGDILLIQFEIALPCICHYSSHQLRPQNWKIPIRPPESRAKIRSCTPFLSSTQHLKEAGMLPSRWPPAKGRKSDVTLYLTFPGSQYLPCLLFQGQKPPFLTHPRASDNILPSNWGLLSVWEGCPSQPPALIMSP